MSQTTKDKIRSALETNKGSSISGEELAQQLGLSRAAVWKAVNTLKEEGYPILSSTKTGYCLAHSSDVITVQGVQGFQKNADFWKTIHLYKTIDSTNLQAKRLADGAHFVVLAQEQQGGRGRMGRPFYSPQGGGIYMSAVLALPLDVKDSGLITAYAAVAAAQTIQEQMGKECGIKWVNDLFFNGKKVCGILTEGTMNFETQKFDSIVVGIGINVVAPQTGFGAFEGVAGALIQQPVGDLRNRIIAGILDKLTGLEAAIANKAFLEEYRARSLVLGQEVMVYRTAVEDQSAKAYRAVAIGIDEQARLAVRDQEGNLNLLSSGEVSIKRL